MKVIQLTSYRALRIIILAAIAGRCFLPSMGSDLMAQTPTDSIIAPNVFTPNDDGDNDFFVVKSENDNPVLLKIFTRAGVLVYSFEAKLHHWDGRSLSGQPMATGVYFYTAEVRNSSISPKVSKCGFFHLYR